MELQASFLYRHSGKGGQKGWYRSWRAGNVVAMQLPRVHRGLASSVARNGSIGLFWELRNGYFCMKGAF